MEKIIIGRGILHLINNNETIRIASSVVIITDDTVAKHWLKPICKIVTNKKIIVIIIKSGEKNKTIKTLEMIWKRMLEEGADRSSVLLALGGGVVCDMGGFAAATFMRGIPIIHIPTTLLAQVDASVGGKTAIDFCGIKNSIGAFHMPSAVFIDVKTLSTLPKRQIIAGFAEVIKHAIIADRALFDLLSKSKFSEIDDNKWIHIITQSVQIKNKFVKQDTKEESGIRKQLNFGHTVGHAIEALSLKTKNSLLHGEAIAIGMAAETKMSVLAGFISQSDENKILSFLHQFELPTTVLGLSVTKIRKLIMVDKKNLNGKILLSLPLQIGEVKSDIQLNPEIINDGILSIIK